MGSEIVPTYDDLHCSLERVNLSNFPFCIFTRYTGPSEHG